MKVPLSLFSPVVGGLFLLAIFVGRSWELPSQSHTFGDGGSESRKVEMVVDGLHCRGTANYLTDKIGDMPGLLSLTTFVQKHLAQIEYDPAVTSVEEIRREIERAVELDDGRIVQPFEVLEVNGE